MISEVSSEISFQIPLELSSKFKQFFVEFDNSLSNLKIESYGISVTTLEEVFLRVGHGEENAEESKEIKRKLSIKRQTSKADASQSARKESFHESSLPDINSHKTP
jgi:hypothetical protein